MKAMFLIGSLLRFTLKTHNLFRKMKNWVWKAYKMDKRWENFYRLGTILLFHLKKAMKRCGFLHFVMPVDKTCCKISIHMCMGMLI
jgi:hypothetical protein